MLTYQTIQNLRKLALKSKLNPDMDDYVERCYRHYSKTYCTPLEQARANLTIIDAIYIYMQDEIDGMEKEDLQIFLGKLTENSGPMLSMPVEEKTPDAIALEDNAWVAQQEELLRKKEEAVVAAKKKQEEIIKMTHEAIENLTGSLNANNKKE